MHFFRLRLVAVLLAGITLISVGSTYFEVLTHKHRLGNDLERRTRWLGSGLQPRIEQQLASANKDGLAAFLTGLRQYPDLPGLAVYDAHGALMASAGENLPLLRVSASLLEKPLFQGKEASAFVRVPLNELQRGVVSGSATGLGVDGVRGALDQLRGPVRLWYEDAIPLHVQGQMAGTLVMLTDADYIRTDGQEVWRRSFLNIVAMVVLVVIVTLLMVRWFMLQPIARAADWLRRLRQGKAKIGDGPKEFDYLMPLANEVNLLTENLTRARAAAETEARLRDAAEHVWTAHRLAVHVRERLGDGRLFVVSNREPYMHVRQGNEVTCVVPPSGLVTAIEPILQACDGTWIAHGSGSEDAAFVDAQDRLRVPPDEPRYTLRRVWLSDEEQEGFYEGFSNEGLWPLCHIAHTRPIFRAADWDYYRKVNARFAEVLIEEMRDTEHPVVFIQDYHFALLPQMVKKARPDARVAIFWHVPWPNVEAFGICPWQAELLDGMLGADLIGFHTQSHCNNFFETVDKVMEARTDWEQFSIRRRDHLTLVRPFPISVAWDEHGDAVPELRADAISSLREAAGEENALEHTFSDLHREAGIEGKRLIFGVDRLDYTKGIVERLLAIEHLLEKHPVYLEKFVFVQIAAPSRTRIPSYVQLKTQVYEAVERINRRFATPKWKPVILIDRQCDHSTIGRYYRAADICLVTSLHDGMNLVAKEYLAARSDCDGVLVLSRFAGAAQELQDALQVNPYDVQQVTESIRVGLEMSRGERRLRMERMRRQVKEHNVYRWAGNVLTDLCAVRIEDHVLEGASMASR